MCNEMKLTFFSRSANEGFARVAVASFFSQMDPTLDEITDIKTAVSEAVTNCIVHAYKDCIGKVEVVARILEGRKIYIRIKDHGCGIEDVAQAMEPMYTTCHNGERAGLGFAVMQTFMDKVHVRSKAGKGVTVTLIKTLSSRGENDA